MSRLIVVSNRLPVTLRPEDDPLDRLERKLNDVEGDVTKIQREKVLLEQEQAHELASAELSAALEDGSVAALAYALKVAEEADLHGPLRNRVQERLADAEAAEAAAQDAPLPEKIVSSSLDDRVQVPFQPPARTVAPAEEFPKSMPYFAFRDALKNLGSTWSGGASVEDVVTESRWKLWLSQARSLTNTQEVNSEYEGESSQCEGNVMYFEDFDRIWQSEEDSASNKGLRAALSLYGDPEAAWSAIGGSLRQRRIALQRALERAQKIVQQTQEELAQERRRPSVPLKASSGGLVAAMKSIASDGLVWVGWPGNCDVDDEKKSRYAAALQEQHGYIPVFLPEEEAEAFYTGFSNSSLWPLLHWMTPYAHYSSAWAEAYFHVNERFADAVIDALKAEDMRDHAEEHLVWIHDYHLFLVPRLLRERAVHAKLNVKIAFFLHTPFPSYEIICNHPNCQDLLSGVLAADLVGFHTHGYLRHFRSAVTRIFGYCTELDFIDHDGMRTKLGVYPIGAHVDSIKEVMTTKEFKKYHKDYAFPNQALVLSVERLDYSKGLPQKLAAIRRFLEITREEEDTGAHKDIEAPSLVMRLSKRVGDLFTKERTPVWSPRNTVFLFVAVPSRQDVQEYRELEEDVHKTISEINGQFSTPTHQPIIYIHRSVPWPELVALYARADCCMVTPLIDGMNLVAKEFVVAKDHTVPGVVPGLVILAELAGASQEMFDALVVNPHDIDKVAKAIMIALEMNTEQRWQFTTDMRAALLKNDARHWAHQVIKELVDVKERIFPRDKAERLLELLGCEQERKGGKEAFSVYTIGDWTTCGLKAQVKPHMRLVEVDGEPVPSGEDAIQAVVEMVEKATSDTVVLGFARPRQLQRSASVNVAPLEQLRAAEVFMRGSPGQKALFLDYDGTLRGFTVRPEDAVPDDELQSVLAELHARDDLDVTIVSGRPAEFLEACFGHYERFRLVAEHGYSVCEPGPPPKKFEPFNRHAITDWMDKVLPVMEIFERSTPGAKVEVKTSALVWHYRNVDPEYGEFKAKELTHTLLQNVANLPCEVSRGKMIVEVSSLQVKKGLVVKHFLELQELSGEPYTAVLCAGDDRTDESMFHYAQENFGGATKFFTVKVGRGNTYANYKLKDPAAVLNFLSLLASAERKRPDDEPIDEAENGNAAQTPLSRDGSFNAGTGSSIPASLSRVGSLEAETEKTDTSGAREEVDITPPEDEFQDIPAERVPRLSGI
eukprot:TRINITY_DN55421_c0_g1_i1.p1 TRINITY_DN55421_c0_g1~~TRINITY_DN55421_c0_g1_i1.p1  ORF type:complete len:1230 (-),score=223.84 TRINITY_DN55421_c0_g1_i1:272-3961(-)